MNGTDADAAGGGSPLLDIVAAPLASPRFSNACSRTREAPNCTTVIGTHISTPAAQPRYQTAGFVRGNERPSWMKFFAVSKGCFIFCFSSCDVFLWDGIVSVVVVVIPGSTSQKRLLFVLAAAGDRVRVPSGNYFESIVCAFRACRGIGRTETRKRKRGFLEKRRFARRFEEQ